MAKKKSVRKKKAKKTSKRKNNKATLKRKIDISLRYLIIFAVLSLVLFMLYGVSNNAYTDLFGLTSAILGFIALAFLIVLLIFLLLRITKK